MNVNKELVRQFNNPPGPNLGAKYRRDLCK